MALPIPVFEDTLLDCDITISVKCIRDGRVYEQFNLYPKDSVNGLAIGTVGSHLQATAYSSLRAAYADALNDRNCVGVVPQGGKVELAT